MANEPVVLIEGGVELRRALSTLSDKGLGKMLRNANRRSAEIVVQKALPNVPVLTGHLKASLRATGTQRFGEARAGGARAPYANIIHWGRGSGNTNFKTGRSARAKGKPIPGRPFLYDAAKASTDQIVGVYTEELDKVLAELHTRMG